MNGYIDSSVVIQFSCALAIPASHAKFKDNYPDCLNLNSARSRWYIMQKAKLYSLLSKASITKLISLFYSTRTET